MPEYDATVRYLPVEGFPGYLVGSDGTLWRRVSGAWREIRASADNRGYRVASVLRPGRPRISKHLHSLVLTAFVGPRPPGMQCRHLDGDPRNCALDNLAWGTPKENGADKLAHRKHAFGQRNGGAKLSEAGVLEVGRMIRDGVPRRDILRRFGIGHTAYYRIAHRTHWKHLSIPLKPQLEVDRGFEVIREQVLAGGYQRRPVPGV